MTAMLSYPESRLLYSNPSKADKSNSISPCNVGFDLRASIGRSAWTGAALSQCRDVPKFERPVMPGKLAKVALWRAARPLELIHPFVEDRDYDTSYALQNLRVLRVKQTA
jgi:hypothetical protein